MKRERYWDSVKFFLVFLVVYVHIISTFAPDGSFNRAFYNFLNLFIMPLFIFVSGRFSQIRDINNYKKGIIRILETYIVFQIIWRTYFLCGDTNVSWHSIVKSVVCPYWILWYLLNLASWRIIMLFIPRKIIQEKPLFIMVMSLIISILGGFVPIDEAFSLQRTMTLFPFFILGFYSSNTDIRLYINKIHPIISVLILSIIFIVVYYKFNYNLGALVRGNHSYWSTSGASLVYGCYARCIYLIVAAIMSVMALRIIPQNRIIAKWGLCTLFIYIYHAFFIKALRIAIPHNLLPGNEICLIIYAIIITIILVYGSRFKLLNLLMNPIFHKK